MKSTNGENQKGKGESESERERAGEYEVTEALLVHVRKGRQQTLPSEMACGTDPGSINLRWYYCYPPCAGGTWCECWNSKASLWEYALALLLFFCLVF
jgi:hypothetical protein